MPSATPPSKPDLERLGDYEIVRELGQGGMGIVYHARQQSLDRDVALKVIRPQLAMNQGLLARFKREYTVHAGLHHPNIVAFYDAGEADGYTFYAMEFLDADPLDQVLESHETTQDFQLIFRVAEALGESLAYLHPKGILHRDIKPGNVMIERGTDRVVLMDFGLVKPKNLTALTREGRTVGSPRYMAPEMLEGRKAEPRSDLYQVGVTLYQLATGRLPFDGEDLVSLAASIIGGRFTPPRKVNPMVGQGMNNLIANCLARDLDDRYASAEDFLRDVRKVRIGRSVAIRREDLPSDPSVSSVSLDASSPSAATQAGGRRSAGLPRLSSSSMDTTLPEERRVMGPLLGAAVALSVLPFAWGFLGGAVVYRAEDVRVVTGVRAALVRWEGKPDYPSRLVVEPLDGEGAPQTILGGGADPAGRHSVRIDGLEAGREYQVKILFPDGKVSLPRRILPPLERGPSLVRHEVRHTGEGAELRLVTDPACKVALRYRHQGAWQERPVTEDYARELRLVLPEPAADTEYREISVELEAVGARTIVELPPIHGALGRLRGFVAATRALDMGAVMQKLADRLPIEDAEATRAFARSLVEVPDLDTTLETLREHRPFEPSAPFTWELYAALRHLEAVDAWLENEGLEPVLGLREVYAPLVDLAWPEEPPAGGIRLVDVEPGDVTSLSVHGGGDKDQMILSIYSATSELEHAQDHRGVFRLDAPPRTGERALVAVRVRNLAPESLIRVRFDDGPGIDLVNTHASFKGFFWQQIRGEEAGPEGVLGAANWITAEVPATLLRAGTNRFHLEARIADGLHPTHYVDVYDLRVWPRAP